MTEEKLIQLTNKYIRDKSVLSLMISYKTLIQNKLTEIITEKQKNNLRAGIQDESIVKSTIQIAKNVINNTSATEKNLFAVSMSVSVILKELDFQKYNSPKGQSEIYKLLIT